MVRELGKVVCLHLNASRHTNCVMTENNFSECAALEMKSEVT
jgi:hypothetical protein